MTVDEQKDFEVISNLIGHRGMNGTWLEYALDMENNRKVKALNETIVRNEGYLKSINKESK